MAVKIRLRRMGAKKSPFYRVVVADSRSPRDGKCIEEIGYFNPMVEPAEIKLDMEKVETWIKNGAQPTERVKSIINSQKPNADVEKNTKTKAKAKTTTKAKKKSEPKAEPKEEVKAEKEAEAEAKTEE